MTKSSQTHELQLPFKQSEIDKLEISDLVYLTGDIIVTVGLPTHQRIKEYIEEGKQLPFDFENGMLCQVGAYIQDTERGKICRYINPSTSTRFEPYLPTIIQGTGVKAIAGKGGVGPKTVEKMREHGCVYLSFIGGASALTSEAVTDVVDVAWEDFILQFRLTCLRVNRLGPLTVGVDVKGNSLYDNLQQQAEAIFGDLMAELNATRPVKT